MIDTQSLPKITGSKFAAQTTFKKLQEYINLVY